MNEVWERLEAYLREHAPELHDGLAPGASEAALSQLERTLGYPLPGDLRASLARHDGERGSVGFLSHDLLSCEGIRASWETQRQVGGEDWRTGWIPVAHDGAGNYVYVDAASGAVRSFDHEGWVHAELADAWREVLEEAADLLEDDQPSYDEDLGWVLDGEEWEELHEMLVGGEELEDLDAAQSKGAARAAEAAQTPAEREAALAVLDQALAADPQSGEARVARARLRLTLGQPAQALEDLGCERRPSPADLAGVYVAALAHWDLGQAAEAREALEGWLKSGAARIEAFGEVRWSGPPETQDVVARLALLDEEGAPRPLDVEDWRRRTLHLLAKGERAGAADALAERLRREPWDDDGWRRLLRLRVELDDLPGAFAAIQEACAAGTHLLGSEESLSALLEEEPGDALARFRRGALRVLQGEHLGAIMDLARVELDSPVLAGWRGRARAAQGDAEGARADPSAALEGAGPLLGAEAWREALGSLGAPTDMEGDELEL